MRLVEITSYDQVDQITDFILTNCKPWLKINWAIEPIFRGSKREPQGESVWFIQNIRTDRKSMDSAQIYADIINREIQNKGLKANRNNSAFVTGSIGEAFRYGDPYVVFPVGEFNYTWTRKCEDFFRGLSRSNYGETVGERITYIASGLEGDNNTLSEAIRSGNEIMIKASSMVYIPYGFWQHHMTAILTKLRNAPLTELENPAKHHHQKRTYVPEPIKDNYTRDEINQMILKKVKYFPGGAKEINNGWCWAFAQGLAKKLGPKAKVVSSSHDFKDGTFPGHSWVFYNGLHYDAESPKGELNPKDMTYHKRLRAISDSTS